MVLTEQIKEMETRREALERCLNIEQKRIDLRNEEEKTQEPNFWDDPAAAREQLRKVAAIKAWVEDYDAVRREVSALASVRERADYIINTTGLSSAMLQSRIRELLSRTEKRFSITVTAFGYKYGLPIDADLVFDVRFLPNPYYISELRPLSGLDDKVASFILERDEAREFMDRLASLLDFIIPLYAEEGRYTLHIAVGCTGGRHRSVAVANALAKRLAGRRENVTAAFRDIEKG